MLRFKGLSCPVPAPARAPRTCASAKGLLLASFRQLKPGALEQVGELSP